MQPTSTSPPPRAVRPVTKRDSILTASAELIRAKGYEHVSLRDIGDAVDVRPSALYRHFSNKQQLLSEVIRAGLAPATAAVDALNLRVDDNALTVLADLALDHPDLGLLWLREVRHLPADEQKSVDRDVYRMIEQLASNCRRVRPDIEATVSELLAWSLLGVLLSASFHGLVVDRAVYRPLLVALLERVITSPVAPGLATALAPKEPAARLEPLSRREALLIQATRLFAQHRYSGVGNEDIGDALGMSGPNIYNHFSSKSELLGLALQRGAGYLQLQLAEVLPRASTPSDGLRGLITSYTGFAVAHSDLVAILMTEIRNLAEPHRQAALTAQRDYVNEWTHLVQQLDASTDHTQARLKVHAALTTINTLSQVDRLRTAAQSVDAISGVVTHMLLSHQEN